MLNLTEREQKTCEQISGERTKYVKFTYTGKETKFITKLLQHTKLKTVLKPEA